MPVSTISDTREARKTNILLLKCILLCLWGCEHTVRWCSVDAYGSMLAHSMAYAAWDVSSESPEEVEQ